MNAKPLFTEDKTDIVAYFCSKCRIVKAEEKDAEACCEIKLCACGDEVKKYYSVCEACNKNNQLIKLKESVASATRITKPTSEYVHSDHTNHNEGFFCLDEIEDVFDDSEMPFYVYDCTKQNWKGLGAQDLISTALEDDWYEGAEDNVVDAEDLIKFVDNWNKKQTLHQFIPNKKIIVLDEEKLTTWLNEPSQPNVKTESKTK